jgi:hypothetical protein
MGATFVYIGYIVAILASLEAQMESRNFSNTAYFYKTWYKMPNRLDV